MAERRKLAAILSADVVGYSRLMGDDEQATVATLTAYRDIFAQHIHASDGRVVDSPGDALLAEFPSALGAITAAVDIQRELTGRNVSLPEHRRMRFRIGVNLGDVTEQDGALYGDGVNITARLESLASPGGISVSGSVYDQVEGKLPVGFKFEGEQSVKNIAKPVRVYHAILDFAERPQARPTQLRRKRPVALIALMLAAIALVGAVAWFARERPGPSGLAKEDQVLAIPKGATIAVLPFSNLSGDPKQDYFADGITEQIISELARFRNLLVIARNSTFRYKGQAVDVRQVGRELGARYVLEGSVRREADKIRVTAQLLDGQTGAHLWAETYERELTAAGVFAVQDEVTEHVVGSIGGAYGVLSRTQSLQSRGKLTHSLDAYECVLRAYEYYRISAEPEHLKARECLERAVQLDSTYADAWAHLGNMYAEEHYQGFNPKPDPLERAAMATRRAVELDPNSQRAIETLAVIAFARHDLDAFFPLAERAVALNPNNEDTLANMGTMIMYSSWTNSSRLDRGVGMVKKAMALNPSYPSWYHIPMAVNYYWRGQYDQALAEAQQINQPDYFWNHAVLVLIYGALDRKAEAQPAIEKLLQLNPEFPAKAREEWRKWNNADEFIDRAIGDLRRAGLNVPPGT